jgi:signal peptidase II
MSSVVGALSLASPQRRGLKWALLAATAPVALALDLLTKRWALTALLPGESTQVLPFLWLQRTSNSGVAFGMLSGRTGLILGAAAVSLLVIVAYVLLEPRPVFGGVAGGLLLGGSLGNLVERVASGSVTDFLKLPYWPTFNLADVFLVTGVALVFAGMLFGGREPDEGQCDPS